MGRAVSMMRLAVLAFAALATAPAYAQQNSSKCINPESPAEPCDGAGLLQGSFVLSHLVSPHQGTADPCQRIGVCSV